MNILKVKSTEVKIIKIASINNSQSGQIYCTDGLAVTQTGCGAGQGAKTDLSKVNKKNRS